MVSNSGTNSTQNRARIVPALPRSLVSQKVNRISGNFQPPSIRDAQQDVITPKGAEDHSASTSSNPPLTPASSNAASADSRRDGEAVRMEMLTAPLERESETSTLRPNGILSSSPVFDLPSAQNQMSRSYDNHGYDAPSQAITSSSHESMPYHQTSHNQTAKSASEFSVAGSQRPKSLARSHEHSQGAMSLVFGSLAESSEQSPAGYAQSIEPRFHPPPTRTSPSMAGTVNAPPFYPAGAVPRFADSPTSPTIASQHSMGFPPYGTFPPWLQPMPNPMSSISQGRNSSGPLMPLPSTARPSHHRSGSQHNQSGMAAWPPNALTPTVLASNDVIPTSTQSEFRSNPTSFPITSLTSYTSAFVGNVQFADSVLHVLDSQTSRHLFSLPGHGLLFARSPRLAAELAKEVYERDRNGFHILQIAAPESLVTESNILEVVHLLYGADPRSLHPEFVQHTDEQVLQRMHHIYGSYVFGHILKIPMLYDQLALSSLLQWDTIEAATDLALKGYQAMHRISVGLDADMKPNGVVAAGTQDIIRDWSLRFIADIVDFLVVQIPQNFVFQSTITQVRQDSRQSLSHSANRSSISNPRLSQLEFGDIGHEDLTEADSHSTIISNILLSLPLESLSAFGTSPVLLHRLGRRQALRLLQSVIQERERLRIKKIQRHRRGKSNDNDASGVTSHEERIALGRDQVTGEEFLLHLYHHDTSIGKTED